MIAMTSGSSWSRRLTCWSIMACRSTGAGPGRSTASLATASQARAWASSTWTSFKARRIWRYSSMVMLTRPGSSLISAGSTSRSPLAAICFHFRSSSSVWLVRSNLYCSRFLICIRVMPSDHSLWASMKASTTALTIVAHSRPLSEVIETSIR